MDPHSQDNYRKMIELQINTPVLECPICGIQSKTQDETQKHLDDKHPGCKPFRCRYPNCNGRIGDTSSIQRWKRHMSTAKANHGDMKMVKCIWCTKPLSSGRSDNIKKHQAICPKRPPNELNPQSLASVPQKKWRNQKYGPDLSRMNDMDTPTLAILSRHLAVNQALPLNVGYVGGQTPGAGPSNLQATSHLGGPAVNQYNPPSPFWPPETQVFDGAANQGHADHQLTSQFSTMALGGMHSTSGEVMNGAYAEPAIPSLESDQDPLHFHSNVGTTPPALDELGLRIGDYQEALSPGPQFLTTASNPMASGSTSGLPLIPTPSTAFPFIPEYIATQSAVYGPLSRTVSTATTAVDGQPQGSMPGTFVSASSIFHQRSQWSKGSQRQGTPEHRPGVHDVSLWHPQPSYH